MSFPSSIKHMQQPTMWDGRKVGVVHLVDKLKTPIYFLVFVHDTIYLDSLVYSLVELSRAQTNLTLRLSCIGFRR